MRKSDVNHCYELVFDQQGIPRKIVFEALNRSSIFADHNRIGGSFEIWEDGARIGNASYSPYGKFWQISCREPSDT